ncbi:transcriptional regulator [Bacteroides faecichinchillae]|uniref:Transcriptional regulator n=1 Tax=Bacteroides faecichinchillae TaxID=871325 RepID=A0A1M4WJH4_9BACE|nr:LuxR C-terminal-related transcriptional regulator [Bacteroides faecichinchillae]THG67837.1 response regulator transcription factor [Bacteroides faecichinchillae]SHE81347.1 transcriptional regulator [Bacteroides faecichinchillae]
MDVLQKEIDEVYAMHSIVHETLDYKKLEQHQLFIHSLIAINGGCAVISDLSNRKSYVTVHPWAHFLGLTFEEASLQVIDSMDEDYIYRRIHPEDLVEKRLLEYKFFQKTFSMSPKERLKYRGRCRLRIMNENGEYQYVDNLVQIMENTPAGNVWLIFCLYSLSADQRPESGIYATITHMERGEVEMLFLLDEHRSILSEREKEILRCIRKGLSSKEIANFFCISVNTVNRHRQNILEKLSVGNSIEACRAAELMKLL